MSTTPNAKKELGQRIRSLRKRQGLTQEAMADRCGLHWTYIGGLERGERNPTLTTMQKVAEGLHVSLTELIRPKVFQTVTPDRERREGKLMRLLQKKDQGAVDLATGIVREILNWREKYGARH